MATVIPLDPFLAAKEVVAANIRSLIKNGDISRHHATHEVCRAVLENHHVKEMDFGKYRIALVPGRHGIRFVPRRFSSSGNCPECGGSQGRWLGIKGQGKDSDKVVWGCKNCLEIFWCWEDN